MQSSTAKPLNHPTYSYVESDAEADGVAWAFTDHDNMVRYPFKFPSLKPNEARVEVAYSGLCHSDSSCVREEWFPVKQYPLCPGHEIVGIVSALGSDVTSLRVGDKVGLGPFRECCGKCDYCLRGYDNLCSGKFKGLIEQKSTYGDIYWGGYSTAVQHPADAFVKIPDSFPLEKAPPLLCPGVTAYVPISKYAKPGDNVAVLGVGGLGHMAVQIAKAWGCNVTAFTIWESQKELIKKLGADNVVIFDKDLTALVPEQRKYDLVLNTIFSNDEKFSEYLSLARPLGTFCQLGLPTPSACSPVRLFDIVVTQVNFVGSLVGSRKQTAEAVEFCAKHKVLPMCEHFEFEDFPKAYDTLLNGRPSFKCVVKCKDSYKALSKAKE